MLSGPPPTSCYCISWMSKACKSANKIEGFEPSISKNFQTSLTACLLPFLATTLPQTELSIHYFHFTKLFIRAGMDIKFPQCYLMSSPLKQQSRIYKLAVHQKAQGSPSHQAPKSQQAAGSTELFILTI